jgi:hypothetical protein
LLYAHATPRKVPTDLLQSLLRGPVEVVPFDGNTTGQMAIPQASAIEHESQELAAR